MAVFSPARTSSVDRQTEHSLPRCRDHLRRPVVEWFKFGCLRLSISRMRCLSSVNCTSGHRKLSSSPTAMPCAAHAHSWYLISKLSNIFRHPGCGHWSVLVRLRGRESFPQCRGHPRGPVGCAHQVLSLLSEVPQKYFAG